MRRPPGPLGLIDQPQQDQRQDRQHAGHDVDGQARDDGQQIVDGRCRRAGRTARHRRLAAGPSCGGDRVAIATCPSRPGRPWRSGSCRRAAGTTGSCRRFPLIRTVTGGGCRGSRGFCRIGTKTVKVADVDLDFLSRSGHRRSSTRASTGLPNSRPLGGGVDLQLQAGRRGRLRPGVVVEVLRALEDDRDAGPTVQTDRLQACVRVLILESDDLGPHRLCLPAERSVRPTQGPALSTGPN